MSDDDSTVTVRADDLRVVLDEVASLDYSNEPSPALREAYDRLQEAEAVARLHAQLQSVSNNRKETSSG